MTEKNILLWAEQKGILANATLISQSLKLQEEINEFIAEIKANNREKAIMELGDVLVVSTILCKMLNRDLASVFMKADTKYIYNRKTSLTDTLMSELEYYLDHINNQHTEKIIISLGNILLISNMFARTLNTNTDFCMLCAYEKIKNRQGKMVNGKFEKNG